MPQPTTAHRPGPWRESAAVRRASTARSLCQAAALADLTVRLGKAGIPSLSFKGPVLSVLLHGDPAARPCDDVDVLVRPRDLAAAVRVVEGAGFEPGIPGAADPARGTQAPFVRADGVVLDLHWRLAPAFDPFPLDREDLFGEAVAVEVLGRPVRTLGPDHLLLYLCFHGAKSLWARRRWVEDVALLLDRGPAFDRNRILALAERTGARRMLAVGVLLAAALRGKAGDPAWTRPDAEARRLAARFGDALARGIPAAAGPAEGTDLQVRLRERPADRASFLLGLCFTPTPAERRRDGIGLLRPLSGGFRLARSAFRHGRSVLGATA